jgi:transglutaminase superfamily protein
MRLLRAFIRRPMADRALVAQAIGVHLAIAGLLRIAGLRRTTVCLARRPPGERGQRSACGDVEHRVAWAVRTATHLVPLGRTCLTEALAAQHLLRRRGHDATLRFGVDKPAGDALAAHAWVEAAGRILIGGESAARYRPLLPKETA